MKRSSITATLLVVLGCWLSFAQAAAAAPGSAWQLSLAALPTHLEPGTTGGVGEAPIYEVLATNVGAGDASGPVTLTATFPVGVTPIFDADAPRGSDGDTSSPDPSCSKTPGQTVTCVATGPVHPSRWTGIRIPVQVAESLSPGDVLADVEAVVSSPGASAVAATAPTMIDDEPPAFSFLPGKTGLASLFTQEDGSPALQAGSRPDQLTVNVGFPVEQPNGLGPVTGAGHPRDIVADLPPGVVVNPNATAVRCTEAQLLSGDGSDPGCPAESQIGMATVVTEVTGPQPAVSALYNMAPAPGAAAAVAFNAANVGIYAHLVGGVRSESDFGLSAETHDALARVFNPLLSAQVQLWGDPTSSSHDQIRDECRLKTDIGACSVKAREIPLLSMPSACSGPLTSAAHARSWEEADKGVPGVPHEAQAQSTDVQSNPVGVSGCSLLDFEPSFTVQPGADSAETPTGVHVELEVPQNEEKDELATSNLEDVTISFPRGMALNPAAADGLQACSPGQIGLKSGVGVSPPSFFDSRPQCPDGSKIGTVEVETPLLDHTLPGAVYVAQPYQNPFGTLLGVYVVIDSPEDGLVVKLAGRTEADPNTGQLTTAFTDNPQLPVASFKVDLFGGPRAALRTPATCGTYTTHSLHTPWSGNPSVPYEDSFQIIRGPNGTPCRSSEAGMPNSPGFQAGTETPIAAAYSPFLGRLTRNDGEQQLKALNATLPPGLTGKLAGVQTCSEAAIAVANAKSGQEELTSPSCPAASQIGEVKVGAGAGPTPYYTSGKIYLAPPYKGAPLSGVVITPAVAGPFDLGTVVVRAPAYVDPITAQLNLRSDDFPHILEGIPLQLRDARVSLDRSDFTLNPSSCDVMAISGQAVSLLNNSAPLAQRFQVGGCRGLDYAPKLFIRLRGGTKRGAHPKLRAVLVAKPGQEANTAKASVALPRSEFLENAHIRTVCTRVQFAAKQCPKGAIYGYARAFTPLLDEPVQGPLYLRSSNNELPDIVAALHGPPDKPIELELKGRIDSVRGGIRTTFDLVPDQPVNKAIFWFKGGNRGLIVNSRNICKRTYRATARFDGQNGKTHDFRPRLNACKKKARRKAARRHRRAR